MKYLLFLFFLFSIAFPVSAYAVDPHPFSLTGNFTYELTNEGVVKVREEIVIKNLSTGEYAPSFTFDTTGFRPENINVYESGIAAKINQTGENTFNITFKRPALGKGANKKVTIVFSDSTLVTKRGNVFELKIPRVKNSDQFASIGTTIRVSRESSKTFHVFPKVEGISYNAFVEYIFDTTESKSGSITAFLGDVAAYDFQLTYPFLNSSFFKREVRFALPPDTAFQKVFIHSFSQDPDSLSYDSDGNWIGRITLKPRESKPLEVKGTVLVFANAQKDFPRSSQEAVDLNTIPQKYWEANDPQIIELAKKLQTPQAIYDYVVQTLSYDYTKTSRPQERLGAKLALSKSKEAICMEFTDLFIALSRAAQIPAREINGFAISNDTTRPRSLGDDILHAWPEYWDSSQRQWIPVDPTWGNTTAGADYFSHFDLDHITFVVHGASSTLPQTPGTYKTEDQSNELIHVEPSESGEPEPNTPPTVSITKSGFSLWQQMYEVTVKNNSGQALYELHPRVFADEKELSSHDIVSILPFSKGTFTVSLYPGFFGANLPNNLSVKLNGFEEREPVQKLSIAIFHFLVLLVPFILIPFVFVTRLRKS
jgi:hypothetical protein